MYAGWTLWRIKPAVPLTPLGEQDFRAACALLRMMIALWFVRGQFTHEIIYSPTFGIGIGLALGYCLQANFEALSAELPGVAPT